MANEEFSLGQLTRITGTFTDADGDAIDPTAVFVVIKEPDDTETEYQYSVDPEVVKETTGIYHLDQDCNAAGWWAWRVYSTGTGQAAEEGRFQVAESEFD